MRHEEWTRDEGDQNQIDEQINKLSETVTAVGVGVQAVRISIGANCPCDRRAGLS
jgi:hypothetical protein